MSHVEIEREVCRCLTAVRKDAPLINNPRDPVRCPYREPLVYDAVISRADHPVQTTPPVPSTITHPPITEPVSDTTSRADNSLMDHPSHGRGRV